MKNNFVTEIELEQIDAKLEIELEEAVLFAERSPYPKVEEALEDIFVGAVTLYE